MLRTLYALTAGVYTPIPALRFSRRVELAEDGSGNDVGLALKFPEDSFTAIREYPPAQQPVVLGNATAQGGGHGPILGWPTQTGLNARAADNYVLASCMTGTTVLRVTEID
jgi:hypothetical protein